LLQQEYAVESTEEEHFSSVCTGVHFRYKQVGFHMTPTQNQRVIAIDPKATQKMKSFPDLPTTLSDDASIREKPTQRRGN
jgi:hypothetical protein